MLDPECFEYTPAFLAGADAAEYLQGLRTGLDWQQREIRLFGRRVMQPRLVAWYGDPGAEYSYSGVKLQPLAWHPLLLEIRNRVERAVGARFNSVLANAYRDGEDSMGWHSDDEKELGDRPTIASLSLGQPRRFLVRAKGRRSEILDLEHGSLLVMRGESQVRYQHCLPKTRRRVGLRINLTYRMVLDRTDSARSRRTAV